MQDGHRGQQSYILDGANTGLGDEILLNADFSINEPAAQTYLNGGLQFDNWVENQNSGLRKFTLIPDGVRCDILEQADTAWNTRLYSDALSLTEGQNYRFTAEVRCSVDGNFNAAIEAANGNDAQPYPETPKAVTNSEFSLVSDTFNYTPDSNSDGSTSSIVAQFYPNYTLPAGEFYEVRNISVKAINDKHHATTVFYGDELVTNGTFETNTTGWTNINGTTFERNTSSAITGDGDLHWAQSETDAGYTGVRRTNANTFVAGRTYVVTFTYRVVGTPDVFAKIGNGTGVTSTALAGYTEQQLNATSNTAFTYSFVSGASGDYYFMFRTNNNHASELYVDNVSIKEVGVASGWTDADQQLHIPQTALQSYNELVWSLPTKADNVVAIVSDNADFDINSSDFTANFWVYLNDYGFGGGQYVFHKGGGGSEGWHVRIRATGQVDLVVASSGSGGDGVSQSTANSDGVGVEKGQWHMITSVIDNSNTIALYIDGALVESTAFPSDDNDIDGGGGLEMFNWATNYASGTLNGTATEFSIFKGVAFSATEVLELFNDGKALDATTHSQITNLKGYWRNDGLNTLKNINNPGTHDATLYNGTETILIPQGVDSTRDAQGFIMNKQKSTSCLNLTNGSDNPIVDLGSITTVAEDAAFSFGMWLKPDDLIANYIIGKNSSTDYFRLESSNAITTRIDNVYKSYAIATIVAREWMHLTITRAAGNDGLVSVYIDGLINGGATEDTEASDGAFDYRYIGGWKLTDTFRGQIDGFLIYSKALDGTEILKNYNATKGNHRN